MLLKAVSLFLIFILVLGMFGKLRAPKLPMRRKGDAIPAAKKCRKCGTYIVDGGTCSCDDRR